jgi:enoyl-CoA hydratase
MAYENLIFEKKDGIAYITINRPKALNALNKAVYDDLNPVLDDITADESVKVVIVTEIGRAHV